MKPPWQVCDIVHSRCSIHTSLSSKLTFTFLHFWLELLPLISSCSNSSIVVCRSTVKNLKLDPRRRHHKAVKLSAERWRLKRVKRPLPLSAPKRLQTAVPQIFSPQSEFRSPFSLRGRIFHINFYREDEWHNFGLAGPSSAGTSSSIPRVCAYHDCVSLAAAWNLGYPTTKLEVLCRNKILTIFRIFNVYKCAQSNSTFISLQKFLVALFMLSPSSTRPQRWLERGKKQSNSCQMPYISVLIQKLLAWLNGTEYIIKLFYYRRNEIGFEPIRQVALSSRTYLAGVQQQQENNVGSSHLSNGCESATLAEENLRRRLAIEGWQREHTAAGKHLQPV